MEISLTKLPWYAQVGAFFVLALAACGVFYYYYEVPVRADITSRESRLKSLQLDINRGRATAKQLTQFRTQVDDL